MTRSFRDPHSRVPNFRVESALPQWRPDWVDRNWRIVPPALPPWSPPPSSPQDGIDPFGDPPGVPPSLQPRSGDAQHRAEADLIDRLLKAYRAHSEGSAGQLPWPGAHERAPAPFQDSRSWQAVEPPQGLPFYADEAETLLRIRPEAVQPPIFFPFD